MTFTRTKEAFSPNVDQSQWISLGFLTDIQKNPLLDALRLKVNSKPEENPFGYILERVMNGKTKLDIVKNASIFQPLQGENKEVSVAYVWGAIGKLFEQTSNLEATYIPSHLRGGVTEPTLFDLECYDIVIRNNPTATPTLQDHFIALSFTLRRLNFNSRDKIPSREKMGLIGPSLHTLRVLPLLYTQQEGDHIIPLPGVELKAFIMPPYNLDREFLKEINAMPNLVEGMEDKRNEVQTKYEHESLPPKDPFGIEAQEYIPREWGNYEYITERYRNTRRLSKINTTSYLALARSLFVVKAAVLERTPPTR